VRLGVAHRPIEPNVEGL